MNGIKKKVKLVRESSQSGSQTKKKLFYKSDTKDLNYTGFSSFKHRTKKNSFVVS
jgi:hypothetical protein